MSRLVARVSRCLWTPRMLRHAPVHALHPIAQLPPPDPDHTLTSRRPRYSAHPASPPAADPVAPSPARGIAGGVPPASSISITPTGAGNPGPAVAPTICTGANPDAAPCRAYSWRRHLYNWLGWTPASRASADTTAHGSSDAATNCSFSAELHRRRRSTDVITSTSVFAIVTTPV